MSNPFFSIAIPAYSYGGKGTEFLEFNFNKLSTQTFKDFEVIISDHNTDDAIKNVVDKWNGRLNLKYVTCKHGMGLISPNLNNAMKHCNGKWIKVLFQDDFLFNDDSLKNQFDKLESDDDIKWLISTFIHSNDGHNFYRLYKPKSNPNIWGGNNTLGNPTNLTIKNKDLIFFDEGLNWLVDCEYYYRLFLKYGEPTILDKITIVNRTHGLGLTDTTSQVIKDKEFEILKNRYA